MGDFLGGVPEDVLEVFSLDGFGGDEGGGEGGVVDFEEEGGGGSLGGDEFVEGVDGFFDAGGVGVFFVVNAV